MKKGWIKLHRSLIDWEWYSDINARLLLIHLLVSVNYEDKKWKGINIKKGSMILSWDSLSSNCGITVSQCRTSMNKLISSGEVTKKVTNKYQVITLLKWEGLQDINIENDKQLDNQVADKSQTSRRQVATTKEDNNIITKYIYSEDEFLKIWGEARMHYDKKPTNISKLDFNESLKFKELIKIYKPQDFKDAMNGLFFQNTLPAVRTRPSWFLDLKNFENMKDCWVNQAKMFDNKQKQQQKL